MKVGDVMTAPLQTVKFDKSVRHASELMDNRRIGSLIVVEEERIVGIVTSRDIRSAHPNRLVADAMTRNPICISKEDFAWEALRLMEKSSIERLVVMDQDKAVGLVTREAAASRLAEWKDTLTNMFRSPYIHAIGEDRLRSGLPFQLLFLDLDRFGEVNKQYGHPVGDDLIRGYANKLISIFDENDHICRYAGDEFAVITTRSDAEIREMIGTLTGPIAIGPAELTASVGWLNEETEPDFFHLPFRELLSRASLMSAKVKRTGKHHIN